MGSFDDVKEINYTRNIKSMLPLLTRLNTLTIANLDDLESGELAEIIEKIPQIKNLTLKNINAKREDIEKIAEKCPNLRNLILQDVDGLHGIDVSKFQNLVCFSAISNHSLKRYSWHSENPKISSF